MATLKRTIYWCNPFINKNVKFGNSEASFKIDNGPDYIYYSGKQNFE